MKHKDPPIDRSRHARIKFELEVRGLTLADVARQAKVGPSAVSAVSIGKGRSAHIEKHIAEALQLDVKDLFPERYPN
nr:helix-turn-helix domain-containing protein [Marinicella sp. W31]MDC2876137.1 helix-turn-helix domain-containing protein [Marinicella sp. W31]